MATYVGRKNAQGQVTHYNPVYLDAGQKVYGKARFATAAEAKDFAEQQEAFIASGGSGEISPALRASMTIKVLFDDWFTTRGNIAATTMSGYRAQMNQRIFPQYGDRHPDSISKAEVRKWVQGLKCGEASRRYTRAALSALMEFAIDDGWRNGDLGNPVHGITLSKLHSKTKKPFTLEQVAALYAAAPSVGAELLMKADARTGLRWGEITELRVKDFCYEDRYFHVRRTITAPGPKDHPEGGGLLVVEDTKGHETRRTTFDQELADEIQRSIAERNLGPEDLIFSEAFVRHTPTLTRTDPHLDYGWWNATFKDICEEAGVPLNKGEGIHMLRHTHGSHMYAATKDRYFVMRRLGHADLNATMIYVHALTDLDYAPEGGLMEVGTPTVKVPANLSRGERLKAAKAGRAKLMEEVDAAHDYDPLAEPPAIPLLRLVQ